MSISEMRKRLEHIGKPSIAPPWADLAEKPLA
jgi:hypothetical protein